MGTIWQKMMCIPMKLKKTVEERRWILPVLLSVVIFVTAIWGIENFNQLLLYDDEFGYWMASAYLTGTDWKSVGSGIPYYSYGYGFLILTPIRLLFYRPEAMYQAAIIVNALLLVASYWIAKGVARQIFEEVSPFVLDILCFLVMLYPANIVFSHIAWAECTLIFFFWVFVWLSLRLIQSPSLLNHMGMALLVMGLYVVHQRTLAVAISTVMVMVWCFLVDKGRRKPVLAFAGVMLICMLIHIFIKNDLINDYYYNNLRVEINNMSGQIGKVGGYFTGEGLLDLLISIAGKLFYFALASLLMAWWAAETLFKRAFAYLKRIPVMLKEKRGEEAASDLSLWYLWLLLAFGGSFMILAIFMTGVHRNDILLYGRYVEHMIGIYLLIGIISFLKDRRWLVKTLIYIPFVLGGAWFCQGVLDQYGVTEYQPYHSIWTSLFLKRDTLPHDAVWEFGVFGLLFCLALIVLLKLKLWKRLNGIKNAVVIAGVLLLSCHIAFGLVLGVMTEKQVLRKENILNIVVWIGFMDEDLSQNIYYCSDTEERYWSESFQFLLKEKPVTVIKTNEIDPDEDAFYIVGNDFLQSEGFYDSYYCILETHQFALIVDKDGELAKEAIAFKEE